MSLRIDSGRPWVVTEADPAVRSANFCQLPVSNFR